MSEVISKAMHPRFYLPVWYCHVYGGHDPRALMNEWSLIELWDAYFDLRIKNVFSG